MSWSRNFFKQMKIGIDARFYNEAGPGRYVKNLISELEKIDSDNTYFIFLKKSNYDSYIPINPKFKKISAPYQWYSLSEQLLFPFKILLSGVDLMHFTQFNIPVFWPGPFIVTIHDMIMHEYSTERDTTRFPFIYCLKKTIYLIVFRLACSRARHILVPSLATRDDLVNKLKIHKEKITVTYEGVGVEPVQAEDEPGILEKYGVRSPYLLYVGSMYPHKNLERLISAFQLLLGKFHYPGKLVIIGKESDFSRRLRSLVVGLGLEKDVIFPGAQSSDGYLSDREVAAFYRQAQLYVFPSLKEGFGLPTLEAMRFGIPVAASRVSCIPEICAQAAVYFDPGSPEDMAEKINGLLTDEDLRKRLITAGYSRAAEFSWKTMAEMTLSAYLRL